MNNKQKDILLSVTIAVSVIGFGALAYWLFQEYNEIMIMVFTAIGSLVVLAALASLIYGWIWLLRRY